MNYPYCVIVAMPITLWGPWKRFGGGGGDEVIQASMPLLPVLVVAVTLREKPLRLRYAL